MVAGLVLGAWSLAYLAGGSHTVAPHLFYIPIVVAAVRFGARGALVAAIAAGVAAGPLLPLNVAAGTGQAAFNWGGRTAAFVVIGQVVAFLVHHSTPSVSTDVIRVKIRRDLRRALVGRHLHVAYQPIVNLQTHRIIGAEALVRWTDPDAGSRHPGDFIPAVEDAGLAHLVSEFVVGEACGQLRDWDRQGLIDHETGFKMAINISGSELGDPELENMVRDKVVRSQIPASWLHLEITETALIRDMDEALFGLGRLRSIGVRLAVDDFGAGESSLRYVHVLPVNTIKIDRSFITALVDDERGRMVVAAVARLAAEMGMATVAEGVETAEHARVLADLGCDLAQGYYFSLPLGPVDFELRLRDQAHDPA